MRYWDIYAQMYLDNNIQIIFTWPLPLVLCFGSLCFLFGPVFTSVLCCCILIRSSKLASSFAQKICVPKTKTKQEHSLATDNHILIKMSVMHLDFYFR